MGSYRIALLAVLLGLTAACASTPPAASSTAPPASHFTTTAPPTIGALLALDGATGKQRWRTQLPMDSVSAPVALGGRVFVEGTKECHDHRLTVAALDEKTGAIAWQVEVAAKNPCLGPRLQVSGGFVIAGGPRSASVDKHGCSTGVGSTAAVALDPATGSIRWKAPVDVGEVLGATDDIVIARGTGKQCLVGVDARSGRVRWAEGTSVRYQQVLVGSGGVIQFSQDGQTAIIQGLDPATGRVGWTHTVPADGERATAAVGDVVTVASSAEVVVSRPPPGPGAPSALPPPASYSPLERATVTTFDPATGAELWHQDLTTDMPNVFPGKGVILLEQGLSDLRVAGLDPRTGVQRWQSDKLEAQGFQAGPPGDDGLFLTGSQAVAISPDDGHVLWQAPAVGVGAAVVHGAVYELLAARPKHQPQGN